MAKQPISAKKKLQWVVSLGLAVPLGWMLFFLVSFFMDFFLIALVLLLLGGVLAMLLVEGSKLAYKLWIGLGSAFAIILIGLSFMGRQELNVNIWTAFLFSGILVGFNCVFTAADSGIRAYIQRGVKTENQLELEELIEDIGRKKE